MPWHAKLAAPSDRTTQRQLPQMHTIPVATPIANVPVFWIPRQALTAARASTGQPDAWGHAHCLKVVLHQQQQPASADGAAGIREQEGGA